MRYKAWPLWRPTEWRWVLEVFDEDGATVLDRLPLVDLLNQPEVARVLDRMVAEAKLPAQPSKFELLSELDPAGEVVPFPARPRATVARPGSSS